MKNTILRKIINLTLNLEQFYAEKAIKMWSADE